MNITDPVFHDEAKALVAAWDQGGGMTCRQLASALREISAGKEEIKLS